MTTGLEFGVDWYPEQWDESRWRSDAARMATSAYELLLFIRREGMRMQAKGGRSKEHRHLACGILAGETPALLSWPVVREDHRKIFCEK